MFKHPAPVATVSSAAMSASSQAAFQQPSSGSGPVTFRDVNPQETFEEGELSDAEESPDLETSDPDRVLSEDQNYRETVRGVRAFMGWTHIPDLSFLLNPALIILGQVTVLNLWARFLWIFLRKIGCAVN